MSTLSDFGSGLKSGGAAPFTQGIAQGASLVMSIDQMAQQRREKEWARDLTLVKTYVDYAGTKGVSQETSATSINKANQLIQKWYPQMKLPQVTPEAMPDYAPILKQGAALIDNLGKDPSKFEFVIGEWGKLNAGWDAENMKKAELSDMEKTARANVLDTLKTMGKEKAGLAGDEYLSEFATRTLLKDRGMTDANIDELIKSGQVPKGRLRQRDASFLKKSPNIFQALLEMQAGQTATPGSGVAEKHGF